MAGEMGSTLVPGLGALGETPSKCPRCGGALCAITTPQGVRLDRCGSCRGLWLDKGEVNFFTAEWEYLQDYALNRAHATEMPCPSCGARLEEGLWTSADIKLDKCPNCGGLFFDAGELAAVGRLHAGLEHSLAEERKVDWFSFPRLYILSAAVLVSLVTGIAFALSLFSAAGASAGALAALGLALLVVAACRFTGNELGDASCRALRGLALPIAAVPQRVALSGTLRCGMDEIRLVDATGSVALWSRMPVPPFPQLDAMWLPRVRALPPDVTVRVLGWYRAWPFARFQPLAICPHGGPGGEIRCLSARATLWGAVGGGALLLLASILIPVARHEPALGYSMPRELVAIDAESWGKLGLHAAHAGKHGEARRHFEQAIHSDLDGPEDDRAVSEALYNLGVVHLIEQKRDDALRAFQEALAKDPRNPWAAEALRLIDAGKPFGLPGVAWKVFDAR